MKKFSFILVASAALLAAAAALLVATPAVQAQTAPVSPYGQPVVLSKEQAQAQAKTQIAGGIVQSILSLERQFETLSNIITANQQHLSQADVIAGLGDTFNAQVQQQGALLLSTVIKANRNVGRADKWLEQDWVQAWIAAYKLDPATGDPASK